MLEAKEYAIFLCTQPTNTSEGAEESAGLDKSVSCILPLDSWVAVVSWTQNSIPRNSFLPGDFYFSF